MAQRRSIFLKLSALCEPESYIRRENKSQERGLSISHFSFLYRTTCHLRVMKPKCWIKRRVRNHAHVAWPIISALPLTTYGGMQGIMNPFNTPIITGSALQPCLVAERAIFLISCHQKRQTLSQVTAVILVRKLNGPSDEFILRLRSLPSWPAHSRLPGRHLISRQMRLLLRSQRLRRS